MAFQTLYVGVRKKYGTQELRKNQRIRGRYLDGSYFCKECIFQKRSSSYIFRISLESSVPDFLSSIFKISASD
jgi:hypothetical protein